MQVHSRARLAHTHGPPYLILIHDAQLAKLTAKAASEVLGSQLWS